MIGFVFQVNDPVIVRTERGVEFGNYRAMIGLKAVVHVRGEVRECDIDRVRPVDSVYPVVTAERLGRHDYVRALVGCEILPPGYFSRVDGKNVVLFSDPFDEDMPDRARRVTADAKFAVIIGANDPVRSGEDAA